MGAGNKKQAIRRARRPSYLAKRKTRSEPQRYLGPISRSPSRSPVRSATWPNTGCQFWTLVRRWGSCRAQLRKKPPTLQSRRSACRAAFPEPGRYLLRRPKILPPPPAV